MNFISRKLEHLYKNVSKREAIISTIVFLVFTALVLPFMSSYTAKVIGVAASPDTNFSFQLSTVYNLVDSYGREGRMFYIIVRWTFDVVWPVVYTAFLLLSISFLSKKINCKYNVKLLYLPLLAVLFDLLENINATIIMFLYPTKIDIFGYLLILSSMVKWITIFGSFTIVIVLLILSLIKRFKKQ